MKTNALTYIFAALMVMACGNNNKEGAAEETAEGMTTVELTDAQVKQLGIRTGPLADFAFAGAVNASGSLTVPPQSEANVSPKVGATVERIIVREGQTVGRGQVLAYLAHPDLMDVQARYLAAVNRRNYLDNEHQRQTKMMAEKVGAGKDFDRSKADLQAAKSEVAMLAAQLRQLGIDPMAVQKGKPLTHIAMTSPIAGTVEDISIETGEYAAPGTSMMHIVNTSQLLAELQVFQRDIPKLKVGQAVTLTVQGGNGNPISGRVLSVGKVFDKETHAATVRVSVEGNHAGLMSGLYVEGRIAAGSTSQKAVTAEGVVDEDGTTYLFTATRGNGKWRFDAVAVNKTREENGMVAVAPTDADVKLGTVALNGAYYLLSEMKKGETGEE